LSLAVSGEVEWSGRLLAMLRLRLALPTASVYVTGFFPQLRTTSQNLYQLLRVRFNKNRSHSTTITGHHG